MKLPGIDRHGLAAMAENEGLPKPFMKDTLKLLAESDVGMLVPYVFSNDDSAGRDPGGSDECLVSSSQGDESAPNKALTKPKS